MSGSDDTQRIAEEHVAFFGDHKGKDLRSWVEQHWAPGVRMTNGGQRSSIPLEQWLDAHSADGGFDFDDCAIEVTKLIVGDDSFALQVIITPSICGQGFAGDPVPACLVHTVANGRVVAIEEFVDASAVVLPEEFASRLLSA
jgi:hypothetical protein